MLVNELRNRLLLAFIASSTSSLYIWAISCPFLKDAPFFKFTCPASIFPAASETSTTSLLETTLPSRERGEIISV